MLFTDTGNMKQKMTPIALYRAMRRHTSLSNERALTHEQNKTAKVILWVCASFGFVYLILIAILLALGINESHWLTSLEFICGISPIILAIDFFFRFLAQQTPAQMVKPYLLLPIPRYTCINNFVASSLLSSGNLIWFFLLVPYALMSVVFSYGLWPTLLLLLYFLLMIMANSQWYAIVRTYINCNLLYWLLPAVVYALVFAPWYLATDQNIDPFLLLYAKPGTLLTSGNPLPVCLALVLLCVAALVNRRVQYNHIMSEVSGTKKAPTESRIVRMSFLNRYGEMGQYLQLEIKSILRNKNPRKTFVFAAAAVLVFSLLISNTDVYDTQFFTNFWCFYNFVLFGAMSLIKIMGAEGNYIDGLMVRRENILMLLRAKYIFYCAILLFPLLLMLPTVFSGKWSVLMLVSYAVFTAGFQYFVLFQMAIYNKQTIPLNTKFISKAGAENNYVQVVVELLSFFLPVLFVQVMQMLVGDTLSYVAMLAIGLLFIATHRLWLRNIYNRLMVRRYKNMESFRASR